MTRGLSLFLIVAVVLTTLAATCLYSGAGPIDQTPGGVDVSWNGFLEAVAVALTLPVQTPGIADVRDVVLPAALGIVLLVVLIVGLTGSQPAETPNKDDASVSTGRPRLNAAEAWVRALALIVVAIAAVSAYRHQSMDLSWGWIVRFAIGAGWMILLAHLFTLKMARSSLYFMLVAALILMILTVAHRADRGYAHFLWPIGPITITAAMAAVWAAMAGALALGCLVKRAHLGMIVPALLVVSLGVWVLLETDRRAPLIGLIVAAFVVVSLLLLARFNRRRKLVGAGIALVALAGIVAGVFYVRTQLADATRTTSGPVALRMALWGASAELMREDPWLGDGPDMFVVDMTNHLAPRRAVSPQFYHGNINVSAHNEWLQAAVELGIPGAVLYLLLPVGVLVLAVRRVVRRADGESENGATPEQGNGSWDSLHLALIAGLVVILVTESASITLRGPIMPVWYWTLLGLLIAVCGAGTKPTRREKAKGAAEDAEPAAAPSRLLGKVVLASAMVLCLLVTFIEVVTASAEAAKTPGVDGRFGTRLYAEKTISSQWLAGSLAMDLAREKPEAANIDHAVSIWGDLYSLMPGYGETPARYAEALVFAGRQNEALRVLEASFDAGIDLYGRDANVLYADLVVDPVESQKALKRLRCVQRALRSSALDDPMKAILLDALQAPAVANTLQEELPGAREIARRQTLEAAEDDVVELLRINACYKESLKQGDEALSDQRLAAGFYRQLEQSSHPYRRAHAAEADAFLNLARMLYEQDPANYVAAYKAICLAEYYAVLGIDHQQVADPQPHLGYVGGVVVPTELPARLYPLWHWSALLHIAAGKDEERCLVLRVLSGLPPQLQTAGEFHRRLAEMYRRAYEDLSRLPEGTQPEYLSRLLDQAQRYEAVLPVEPTATPTETTDQPNG